MPIQPANRMLIEKALQLPGNGKLGKADERVSSQWMRDIKPWPVGAALSTRLKLVIFLIQYSFSDNRNRIAKLMDVIL